MATRRMRIKAVINVRAKTETPQPSQEPVPSPSSINSSLENQVTSPIECAPVSPLPLSTLSPGPSTPKSPLKSPINNYVSPSSPVKHFDRERAASLAIVPFSPTSPSSPFVSPSISKPVDSPEAWKKRTDDSKKKEAVPVIPTKFATARKEFFDKIQSGQLPERNKLTMLHFTFYNPPNPNKKALPPGHGNRQSRSRASSICSDVSSLSKQEIQNIGPANDENLAKALSAPSSIAGSRRTTASSMGSGGSLPASEGGQSQASEKSNTSSNGSVPGPRVKVGPDGQLIIDEKSLVMETSESQRARRQLEDMEVVSGAEYAVGSSGFYRYKRSYRRGNEWTERETVRFYRALNQCGTDFSMMQKLFPYRTRHELKSKFKREDRKNSDLISKVLQTCVFDPDEAISSDEDTGKQDDATNKAQTIDEGGEVEEVICCSEQVSTVGKRKRTPKAEKKEMKFSTMQLEEMNANLPKGPGTGKGKKWNTPVEGLVGGKLILKKEKECIANENKSASDGQLNPSMSCNSKEDATLVKPKRKYVRKKKQVDDNESAVNGPKHYRANIASSQPHSSSTMLPPGTVSVLLAAGVVPSVQTFVDIKSQSNEVKKEKMTIEVKNEKSEQIKATSGVTSSDNNAANKRRSRLPKAKPKFKSVESGEHKKLISGNEGSSNNPDIGIQSSQSGSTTGLGVCDELFRFDTSDPAGLRVIPASLLPVEETVLVGNEEGAEDLVVVDLDEINAIKSDSIIDSKRTVSPVTSSPATGTSRKRKKIIPNVNPVRIASTFNDPYGLPATEEASTSSRTGGNQYDETEPSSSSSSSGGKAPKCVKTMPFRVPGPGSSQPNLQSHPSSELVLEINLSES